MALAFQDQDHMDALYKCGHLTELDYCLKIEIYDTSYYFSPGCFGGELSLIISCQIQLHWLINNFRILRIPVSTYDITSYLDKMGEML